MARCSAITQAGAACKVEAIADSSWCWNHHPEYEEQRALRASKGGKRGGRGRSSPATAELARLQGRFEELADKVLGGELERGDGAVVAQLLNGARACVIGSLKAREQEELLERVELLERRLQQTAAHGRKGRPIHG